MTVQQSDTTLFIQMVPSQAAIEAPGGIRKLRRGMRGLLHDLVLSTNTRRAISSPSTENVPE